jgi:hypothetical protein
MPGSNLLRRGNLAIETLTCMYQSIPPPRHTLPPLLSAVLICPLGLSTVARACPVSLCARPPDASSRIKLPAWEFIA